ncbi:MAG: hypothetical protein F4046_06315 [Acidimicrobiaceae bacterium]|nr:hypothetical protein [Acidimicrobiaceae bacterium]
MAEVTFMLRSCAGAPVAGAMLVAEYPNGTYRVGESDAEGECRIDLYRTDQPMRVLAAAEGCLPLHETVVPDNAAALELVMEASPDGRSGVLFTRSTGFIPGIEGRLNPISDGRTYLYADNIAVDGRVANPVPLEIGQRMHLTDVYGVETDIRFIAVTAQFSLIEYSEPRPYGEGP